jgi:hypothetical protein
MDLYLQNLFYVLVFMEDVGEELLRRREDETYNYHNYR